MKNVRLLFLLYFMAAGFLSLTVSSASGDASGRSKSNWANDSGSEIRAVGKFSKLAVNLPGEVVLSQGNNQELKLEADKDVLALITTEVADGHLRISVKEDSKLPKNNSAIRIYITAPTLEAITVAGSGKITGRNKFTSDQLHLSVAGSGSIQLAVKAKELKSSIAGSGNLDLSGSCDEHSLSIAGSGNARTYELDATRASVRISGSGDCQVTAQKDLEVRISGSGSVKYKGNAQVSKSITGSGSVAKAS